MLLKQHLRLGGGSHAIKEATLSLFFNSCFADLDVLRTAVSSSFPDLFNQAKYARNMSVELQGQHSEPDVVSSSAQLLGVVAFQAEYEIDNVITRVLNFDNNPERVAMSLHNLQYNRWADFLALFERITNTLSPLFDELLVIGISLHYVDELEWTKQGEQLPVAQLYKQNLDYFPRLFFKNSIGEVTLTAAQTVKELTFFDRLHITSANDLKPVATISHNVVYQLPKGEKLSTLIEGSNSLSYILQVAHEHNKSVLGEILQSEVQEFIGLIPTTAQPSDDTSN